MTHTEEEFIWHDGTREKEWFKDNRLDGESRYWYPNGQLWMHCFSKDNNLNGECKVWYKNGRLHDQGWFKDNFIVAFPKNIKLKKGYILGGDGRYYKD